MRVVLSSWGSRGDVQPLAGLAVRLQELGSKVVVCAPPDEEFAVLLARVGVPHVPLGPSVRALVTGQRPPSPQDAFRVAAELVAARFETLVAAAEGADVLLATGLMPAGARSVAEHLGIRYVYACFHPFELPSPHYPPSARPGRPTPPEVTDSRALWDLDAERVHVLYGEAHNRHRASVGLPPVDNTRDHVFTERPWLAADPVLCPGRGLTTLDVIQTGAWVLPDDRALPGDLDEFLNAGPPPVYVGFGSLPMRAAPDVGRVAIEAVRAQGRRVVVSSGWADLAPIDEREDCFLVDEVNHRALFGQVAAVVHHGGVGTTTTAALAGAPQVLVPQFVDQPYWAARVTELGIGAAHDGPVPTVDSLSTALATALSPEVRARAQAVAVQMRTDGAEVAARMLLTATPTARRI